MKIVKTTTGRFAVKFSDGSMSPSYATRAGAAEFLNKNKAKMAKFIAVTKAVAALAPLLISTAF